LLCKQNDNTIYNKMKLSDSQIEVLQRINKNLEYGDINTIAEKSKKTRVYVSSVLNLNTRTYNEDIINAAIGIISERDKARKKNLEKLPA